MPGKVVALFDRPGLLILAAVLSLVSLPSLARFFFGSFAEFKSDLGLDSDLGRNMWLLGLLPSTPELYFKIVAFLGSYFVVVLLAYSLFRHVLDWLAL